MRRLVAMTLMGALVLVIIVAALSVWSWRGGGEGEGYYNSTSSVTETEAQPLDLETMTTTREYNVFSAKERRITEPLVTTLSSTAKVTRTPCRTKTGVLCKSWVYFGQTISG